jgi:glycerol-3-phosphate dehydrogenase (NAD(P)+)
MSPAASVFGAGPWGSTLAWLLARSERPVLLWTRDAAKAEAITTSRQPDGVGISLPPNVTVTSDPVALEADLVVLAVPPAHVRALVQRLAKHLEPRHRVLHVIKGFEASGSPVSRVVEEETCVLRTGVIAGPIVPSELWGGDRGAAIVGSRYQGVVDEVTDLLASDQLRVYGTCDLLGVEIAGALRTPVGVASGLLREAGFGRALGAVLLTRAVAEGARLCTALGADPRTVSGLSGIGDWMLTATSREDGLMQAGARLARGVPFDHPEAEARIRTLVALGESHGVDLPIVEAVSNILDGVALSEALAGLMARAQRSEFD